MTKSHSFDVVVVGGGAIGLAIAHELAQRRSGIALISPRVPIGAASTAAGAMIDAFGEMSEMKSSDDAARLEIEIEAQRMYPKWLEGITERSGHSIFQRKGVFVISNRDGTYDEMKMRLIKEQLRNYGEEFEKPHPSEVPGLQPNHQFPVHEALFIPNAMSVDTAQLLPALEASIAKDSRVLRIYDEVRSVDHSDGTWRLVTACGSTYVTRNLILSAGAYTLSVLGEEIRKRARLPKLFFGRGASCTVVGGPPVPYTVRTPNRILACGFHMVPRAAERTYLGATNWFGTQIDKPKGPSVGELHSLLDSLMNQLNSSLYAVSIEATYWGLRPVSQYDRPMVGLTHLPNLYIATGTHRTGVHLAPAVARIVAAELESGSTSPANPFSACRTETDEVTRSLSNGVRALLAQSLFPNGSLPFNRIAELQVFITSILELALDRNQDVSLLEDLRTIYTEITSDEESMMRMFYEVLEQRLSRAGPYPT